MFTARGSVRDTAQPKWPGCPRRIEWRVPGTTTRRRPTPRTAGLVRVCTIGSSSPRAVMASQARSRRCWRRARRCTNPTTKA
eukprot:4433286-Prymnesium_polylepis.1